MAFSNDFLALTTAIHHPKVLKYLFVLQNINNLCISSDSDTFADECNIKAQYPPASLSCSIAVDSDACIDGAPELMSKMQNIITKLR